MQRIGVFVCHCGTNIAGTVDVKRVVEAVRKEPGVVYAEDYQYMCSEAGQQKIADAVKSEHLTGIVIFPVPRVCTRELSVRRRKKRD